MGELIDRRLWWLVAGIAALGLGLRIAAAQGGLWLDEAWSAVMADQAATPLGIFLHVNHDNNHHLNSLWLQLVGPGAPPPLQRALSIVSGTATVLVAASLGARRNAATALVAAALFALSPILVTYGSEARGYAPMLLALLVAARLIDRWLERPDAPPPAIPLALTALLGILSHLTMVLGLAALGLWAAISLRGRHQRAFALLARLFLPAAIATLLALMLILLPAWIDGGMAFGASEPFTLDRWAHGLAQALHYAFGHGWGAPVLLAASAMLLGLPLGRLATFGYAALLAVPALVLVAHLPNAGVARLYLPAVTGLLLLFALMLGNAFARGQRLPVYAALALALAMMATTTRALIADRRADPARAITALAARAPAGADIAVDHPRSEAILQTAAASAGYALTLRQPCPPARFLFVERDGDQPFPAAPTRCATRYREITGDTVQGLSGTQWKLYERSAR